MTLKQYYSHLKHIRMQNCYLMIRLKYKKSLSFIYTQAIHSRGRMMMGPHLVVQTGRQTPWIYQAMLEINENFHSVRSSFLSSYKKRKNSNNASKKLATPSFTREPRLSTCWLDQYCQKLSSHCQYYIATRYCPHCAVFSQGRYCYTSSGLVQKNKLALLRRPG